jgi:DNA-binding CsgD family transcriptional regulator
MGGHAVKEARAIELFTIRELEILALLGQGKTSKEIAVLLNLGVTTIASHRRNICRKLRIHSTAELIVYAAASQSAHSPPANFPIL